MADNQLEDIVAAENKKDISLRRIALVTLCYGTAGALIGHEHAYVIAPATALIGAGASVYDEVKKRGMNLFWPGMGMLVGGLIGSIFEGDSNKNFSPFLSYGGAALGGALGFYKSILIGRKSRGSVEFEIKIGE